MSEPIQEAQDDRGATATTASFKPNVTRIAAFLAAMGALGGVLLHLIGYVAHRTYLGHMGVNFGLFPKSTDWLLINGYYTLADRLFLFSEAFAQYKWHITGLIIGMATYMLIMEKLGQWIKNKGPFLNITRLPQWFSDIVRNLLTSAFVFIGAPLAIMAIGLMLLIPAVIGEVAGKHVAQKSEERIIKMCADSQSCARLEFAGKVIAVGYIIDASESRIAIFDPVTRTTSIHNTDGTTIIGGRLQADKSPTD